MVSSSTDQSIRCPYSREEILLSAFLKAFTIVDRGMLAPLHDLCFNVYVSITLELSLPPGMHAEVYAIQYPCPCLTLQPQCPRV